jgi:multidrug efflux pump subunit AcrA (membrane-fusion protein)
VTVRARRWLAAAVLLAIAGPLLVERLWVTDEKRVEAALVEFTAALEARDAARAALGFEPKVAVEQPIRYLRRDLPLSEALAFRLARLQRLRLERDETEITFPADGVAAVVARGSGTADDVEELPSGRVPFSFELRLRMRREGDDRFLLAAVESCRIEPFNPFKPFR